MSTTPPSTEDLSQRPLSQGKHRPPRPRSLNPEPDVPPLEVRWFHATDNPINDPTKLRRERSQTFKSRSGSSSPVPNASLPPTPKAKAQPSSWIAFSKRDSLALEKAYQGGDVQAVVPVNEDELFQVDVSRRTISPVYWEGPTYDVRRATWFIQGDSSKWVPCEETFAEQIELGYYKYKPWVVDAVEDSAVKSSAKVEDAELTPASAITAAAEEKKLEKKLEKQPVDRQWNLLGPYMGQYIVYTGPNTAWLLSNTASGKITKKIFTRLTNSQNLGGTRLLRGFSEVSKQSTSAFSRVTGSPALGPTKPVDESKKAAAVPEDKDDKETKEQEDVEMEEAKQSKREAQDYENEDSADEPRKLDHLVFVIHGIGQKMSERLGQNFVHDVNILRRSLKTAFPHTAAGATNRTNGIQVLPIHWRQDIVFGMASEEEGVEADLGMPEADDGQPTLAELTLDGVPNIRTVVSDVLLDIPLYMTPKYRDQMMAIITKEINRVYQLFIQRNPEFLQRRGKVSIYGHSLGSLLAFDVLAVQPFTINQHESVSAIDENMSASHISSQYVPQGKASNLLFPVQNFFAVGSPLGFMLLLKGCKIASRKFLSDEAKSTTSPVSLSASSSPIPLCYPAIENLYNIFKQSDPVAYRLEPLIARHYTANLKPEIVPFTKGGLKSVLDAGYNVGSGLANRAGAMYESLKMGITTNLFMRGLGLSRQQMLEDMNSTNQAQTSTNKEEKSPRARSSSDPSPPVTVESPSSQATVDDKGKPLLHMATYSHGARKLRKLNRTGRVDWCVQEGLLDNPYLNAFAAHTQYWQDLDVAAFLIREIYPE
ncbi:hypothetical protein INT43_001230 [Umbelopsis isabellina]|uniref:DDHD domain-containing protein n=1 Tax=Mortierella isabellina TaxID=91625 RepID=A0A8H7UD63_MORIS|nr:hypothetical protein INT43_001230 [Umbelopsis isabellina]